MTEGVKSEALFFEIYFFEEIPPSCRNGNPPPFTREAKSGLKGHAHSI